MYDHHHNHHAGAPVMEPANQPSAGQLRDDVSQAVISVTRRRRVVESQQDAGEGLKHEKEHGHAAEHLMPAARGRDVLVQEVLDSGFETRAVIGPFGELLQASGLIGYTRGHPVGSLDSRISPSSSLLLWTLASNRSSARGAGPETTLPSIENTDV